MPTRTCASPWPTTDVTFEASLTRPRSTSAGHPIKDQITGWTRDEMDRTVACERGQLGADHAPVLW